MRPGEAKIDCNRRVRFLDGVHRLGRDVSLDQPPGSKGVVVGVERFRWLAQRPLKFEMAKLSQ